MHGLLMINSTSLYTKIHQCRPLIHPSRTYILPKSSRRHTYPPIHATLSLSTNVSNNATSSSLFSNLPILGNKELMQRISVSFLAISIYRLGHYIQTPGIPSLSTISPPSPSSSATTTPISFTEFISGGWGEVFGNIFSLSIGPVMETYLLFGVLNVLPEFKQHMAMLEEEGEMGRRQIKKYINSLFVFFAIFNAYRTSGTYLSLTSTTTTTAAAAAAATPTFLSNVFSFITERLPIMLTLIAGATICKYLLQWVDAQGLGEGAGLFIGYSIALQYSKHLSVMIPILMQHTPPLLNIMISAVVVIGLVLFVVLLQRYEYRVPLTFYSSRQARSVVDHPAFEMLKRQRISRDTISGIGRMREGEKKSGPRDNITTDTNSSSQEGEEEDGDGDGDGVATAAGAASLETEGLKTHLPFRLSPNGARQLLFVNFWISILELPLSTLGVSPHILHSPLVFAGLVFFMESFSIGDTSSKQLSQYLVLSNAGVVGHSPGTETERLLTSIKTRLKLVNATILACLSLVTHLVDVLTASLLGGVPVGCLNILLLTSSVLGVARQWDALGRIPAVSAMIEKQKKVLESASGGSGNGSSNSDRGTDTMNSNNNS